MSASGIAAYAVVIGLLQKMEERGDLPRVAVIDILDGALSAIEEVDTDAGDVRLARKMLERQIKRWRG
jgi:hypothetical protein